MHQLTFEHACESLLFPALLYVLWNNQATWATRMRLSNNFAGVPMEPETKRLA